MLHVLAIVVDNKDVNLVDSISICTFDDATLGHERLYSLVLWLRMRSLLSTK